MAYVFKSAFRCRRIFGIVGLLYILAISQTSAQESKLTGSYKPYLYLGTSARHGSYDLAIGLDLNRYLNIEFDFIDEGKQPQGIRNINRILSLNAVPKFQFGPWTMIGKFGVTTSRYGHNGSGIDYKNHTGFTGHNFGLELDYQIGENLAVTGQILRAHYQQVDRKDFESFTFGSLGLKILSR